MKNTMNKNIIITIISAAMAFTACNSTPKTEEEKQLELDMRLHSVIM